MNIHSDSGVRPKDGATDDTDSPLPPAGPRKKSSRPSGARRGFAAMSPEKQRAIAASGGKAAHEMGRAHEFTSDEAAQAGALGGAAVYKQRGPEWMSRIGKMGGRNRGRRKQLTIRGAE